MSTAGLNYEPWPWTYLETALSRTDAEALSAEFPVHLLVRFPAPVLAKLNQGLEANRRCQHRTGTLSPNSAGLSPRWRQFIEFLHDDQYVSLVERLTGRDLSRYQLHVYVWEYGCQDWLGPHVDSAYVTQLFYFTPDWTEYDGGYLHILATRHSEQPYQRLAPACGASSILCRTEQAWHAVEPVATPGCIRRSATAFFRSTEPGDGFASDADEV